MGDRLPFDLSFPPVDEVHDENMGEGGGSSGADFIPWRVLQDNANCSQHHMDMDWQQGNFLRETSVKMNDVQSHLPNFLVGVESPYQLDTGTPSRDPGRSDVVNGSQASGVPVSTNLTNQPWPCRGSDWRGRPHNILIGHEGRCINNAEEGSLTTPYIDNVVGNPIYSFAPLRHGRHFSRSQSSQNYHVFPGQPLPGVQPIVMDNSQPTIAQNRLRSSDLVIARPRIEHATPDASHLARLPSRNHPFLPRMAMETNIAPRWCVSPAQFPARPTLVQNFYDPSRIARALHMQPARVQHSQDIQQLNLPAAAPRHPVSRDRQLQDNQEVNYPRGTLLMPAPYRQISPAQNSQANLMIGFSRATAPLTRNQDPSSDNPSMKRPETEILDVNYPRGTLLMAPPHQQVSLAQNSQANRMIGFSRATVPITRNQEPSSSNPSMQRPATEVLGVSYPRGTLLMPAPYQQVRSAKNSQSNLMTGCFSSATVPLTRSQELSSGNLSMKRPVIENPRVNLSKIRRTTDKQIHYKFQPLRIHEGSQKSSKAPIQSSKPSRVHKIPRAPDSPPKLSGYKCYLCHRDLSFSPQGPVSIPEVPPQVAILPCHHTFHDVCLQKITPDDQAKNPPCLACALGENQPP